MQMRMLRVFDGKDYTEAMPVFKKHAVRAIIVRDGTIAMQRSREGEYKILGGGVDKGETFHEALAREVLEESGLMIKEETIREIGEVLEVRRDCFDPDLKYECHSFFYFCDAKEEMGEPAMTPSEIAKGFHLVWASPREIIEGNQAFLNQRWIYRDTEIIRMFYEGKLKE